MAQRVVRQLEEEVALRLRRRAMRQGLSMEEEVRAILRQAVQEEAEGTGKALGSRIVARFAGAGLGEEIPEIATGPIRPGRFEL